MTIPSKSTPGRIAGVSGLLAAALALGVGELVAAFVHPRASPVVAIGTAFIRVTPTWLKEFAVRVFGTYDKLVLIIGILVVLAAFAPAVGRLARRHLALGMSVVGAFGVAAAATALTLPDASWSWALPPVFGAVASAGALRMLTRASASRTTASDRRHPTPDPTPAAADTGTPSASGSGGARPARRSFLLAGVGVAAVAGTSGGIGRVLSGRRYAVASSRAGIRLPGPDSPAAPVPAGADLDVPHVPSFFTPNDSFYRIDTALTLPQVPPEEWTLRVHGMVDRPIELSYAELLQRSLIQRDITLACVSNPVGGPYVGNARWLGVRLADLLDEAGVHTGADELLSTSADGWTCGTPVATVMDGRDAMLAVAMNGKPLPVLHGFPVRMVVPGLYGYVSATKWVVDLELTTFAKRTPYWAKRGWALKAPVNTMSRIDTPTAAMNVRAGRVPIAGVAWAQHRGIKRVEVRVDGGSWQEARLAPVPSADTWRQWVHYWDAEPGRHQLQVRATDGRGRTQTPRETPPVPDGATGWHTVPVTVA